MSFSYRVKTVVFLSGERFPVLLDRSGYPMFYPTVFALTEVRGRNLASNTIGNVLRSIMAFYLFLDARGIDLGERLVAGELLSLSEVEDLARLCRWPLADLAALSSVRGEVSAKVMSLENARMGSQSVLPVDVDPDVSSGRLRYIRMYLQWLAEDRLSRHGLDPSVAARLTDASMHVTAAINARVQHKSGRSALTEREGLSDEAKAELLRVIDPHSPDNPWRDQHTRYRNALLVHWLIFLGLRIGEALGVRVSDIVVHRKEVTIHRRADDPHDPRRNQPQTKTRGRVLLLSETLLAETQAYILNHRSTLPRAKFHSFLFVASHTGEPLSQAAVGKMFGELRDKCPSLPKRLTPHVLRFTWNDNFSKLMEKNGVPPEKEESQRSYLMGWSPTSKMAAVYTRRYVRNKAKEASLALQNQLVKGEGKENE